ncbi:tetratricopeptide repeat protein [Thermodesulforhabdus norvegica]|uniref:Tetratricopeptide repeat protein n=1 Tax=Thermodesulforhabdus norvegica TaxID=39841 RepID=A0A1I4VSQ9_9BACT|nr:tetratricopeptide repeat protein [Thermodesulforhabdus norvegica]SFN04079.1 hypothetical protein SAMN05660836_02440 [Thermodesulforhabdus norvegica]
MGLLSWPKQLFYNLGSRVAIFLVRRRIKKGRTQPHVWLVLARLHEVRREYNTAVEVLRMGLKEFPNNPILNSHLKRLENHSG